MRQLLVRTAVIGILGSSPVAALSAAEPTAGEPALGTVALEDIEARCAAAAEEAGGNSADVQHCIARLRSEWQQSQLNAVRSQPVAKPQAPELNASWQSPTPNTLRPNVNALRLSLDGE